MILTMKRRSTIQLIETVLLFIAGLTAVYGIFSVINELIRTLSYDNFRLESVVEEIGEVLIGNVIVPLLYFFIFKTTLNVPSRWHVLLLGSIGLLGGGIVLWILAALSEGPTIVVLVPIVAILTSIVAWLLIRRDGKLSRQTV